MELTPSEQTNQKVSPISLPNPITTNHNYKPKAESTSLRAGVSLDAGALAKQAISPIQTTAYANVNPDNKISGNGCIPNGPCNSSNQNSYVNSGTSNSKFLKESVTC